MKKSNSNENDYAAKLKSFKMKPLPEADFEKFKRYCKKCKKNVIAIKERKTTAKKIANVISYIDQFPGPYSRDTERCPYCNKVLRKKPQKT